MQRATAEPLRLHPRRASLGCLQPTERRLVGPDGAKYGVEDSRKTGDDGWKDMLAPAG